jgi:hypothetical protein
MLSTIFGPHLASPAQAGTTKKPNGRISIKKKSDENCKSLNLKQKHINIKVELFTAAILQAAKETIPRGKRKHYIPGWNPELQQLHNTVSELREKMEQCPSDENTIAHNKAKAEFTRQKLQQTRAAWQEKNFFA